MQASQKSMKKIFLVVLSITVFACSKVPISGRRQLHLLPESLMMNMSFSNYSDVLKKTPPVVASDADAQMVNRVGQKIAASVAKYVKQKKITSRTKGFKWEFHLINENTVNAWCMPGGKVVVYTGLLSITKNENALAVVMGHEIAHAIARHGNERMSEGLLAQMGGIGLQVALMNKPQETQNIFMQSYGLGSQLGLLKYSRTHESEADKLGLVFCAMAGYNPNEAIDFWKRMAAIGGAKPPQILSTHPSDETRIKDLKAFMPQALKYYKPS
jgi:predicted Zn-dependent protease